jgi:hypothetical protein
MRDFIYGFVDSLQVSLGAREVRLDIVDEYRRLGSSRLEFRGVKQFELKRRKSFEFEQELFVDSFVISQTASGIQVSVSFLCEGEGDVAALFISCRQAYLIRFDVSR